MGEGHRRRGHPGGIITARAARHLAPLAGRGRERSERVRGSFRGLFTLELSCPSPQPSPRKNGEREQTEFVSPHCSAVEQKKHSREDIHGRPPSSHPAQRSPRRHAHRLGRADHDGRRAGAARRRVPAGRGRPISRHPHLRPLRQGPRVPGRLSERVGTHGAKASRRHRGFVEPLPAVGSGRSREMGAARLRLRARGFTRCRLFAGPGRSVLAARDQGFLRLHRMGRRAAVVERQGRAQRHLLLRLEPVARRDAAAAASRRDVHLGGLRRLVSRHDAPRRHPLHVLGELVRHAGEDRAVRRRRARQAQPRARRAGVRAGDAVGAGTRQQPRAVRRRHPRPSAGGRLPPRPLADLGEGDDAVPLVGQLGRPAAASARQFRGLLSRGGEEQMAGSARHRALDAFLHRLRPRIAAPLLRPLPARQEQRLGQAAARAAPGASHRQVRRAA